MQLSPTIPPGRTPSQVGLQRRSGRDRRGRPTPLLCRFTIFGGRRRTGRRAGETAGAFVDNHGPVLFTVTLAIIGLNILDAWFTIFLLAQGGQEMNPVVAKVLELGIGPFIACKSVGIGICLAFLTLTKNFTISRVGLTTVLVGYSALLVWHLYLAARVSAL